MENKIDTFVIENPDWQAEGAELVARFEFEDFIAVKEVVREVMQLADQSNHHPTVIFGYNTIEIRTVTHDEGSIVTEKDFVLAEAVSQIVAEHA